ncbi:Uncharacterised protein [Mycobacteroides abscessus subsp. abscessus]|nr:Uncharacterised protein [Mycobacteroides abscessus subsp. abscessus]
MEKKIGFGLGTVAVGGTKVKAQADAAVFTFEPIYIDIESYESGIWDKYVDRYDVKLKVVFEDQEYEQIQLAFPLLQEIEGMQAGTVSGLKDGGAHKRVRSLAKPVTVHPNENPTTVKDDDLTLYKAYPIGVYEREYGKGGVAKYEVEFACFPRFSDATKPGNYFRFGTDELDMEEAED